MFRADRDRSLLENFAIATTTGPIAMKNPDCCDRRSNWRSTLRSHKSIGMSIAIAFQPLPLDCKLP
ncbi:hypothetical protein [Roseofilum casamattae]|uniref:Uncharacterized protein n=1 Tax=Roseofilum casamattae BLCC-M143 TaxID=3022442 RepID=A0ABT7C1D2_9CYAN|nr:hypothetical protein [Roseofilum casamattae]MDJ1185268.1 hypothetical protein [Roseofilum casamattae BLCC-M143]